MTVSEELPYRARRGRHSPAEERQRRTAVPGSIFSSDWLMPRLQRAGPRMPAAQCAWRLAKAP